jgi:hypothetical protein
LAPIKKPPLGFTLWDGFEFTAKLVGAPAAIFGRESPVAFAEDWFQRCCISLGVEQAFMPAIKAAEKIGFSR